MKACIAKFYAGNLISMWYLGGVIPGVFNTAAIWQPVLGVLHGAARVRIANLLTQDSIAVLASDAWRLVADRRAMLRQLAIPARVVCGRQDRVAPPALSEELAQFIPGARQEWIEHSGHQTPLKAPAMVARHLQTLISTLGRL